jgi:ubiquinone/menaquinone biosynthesis C-methylase UbiE
MSYLNLDQRVPETSALEPKAVTWFYSLIGRVPLVRTTHRRVIAGALAQGVTQGYGLDLGTGPGYVATEIARQRPGLRMVGLDLAAHMVEKATQQARRAGLNGQGSWLQADGHVLPFAEGTFDLLVSSFALHHWHDPLRILNEIARVLRPKGRYYIADVCREVAPRHKLFAYASIPAVSLPLGSYWGYGGYYESVRAGYTREEAWRLLAQSDLPPGEVGLDSTWFVPIVTLASEPAEAPGSAPPGPDRPREEYRLIHKIVSPAGSASTSCRPRGG